MMNSCTMQQVTRGFLRPLLINYSKYATVKWCNIARTSGPDNALGTHFHFKPLIHPLRIGLHIHTIEYTEGSENEEEVFQFSDR